VQKLEQTARLSKWERAGLILFLLAMIVFGAVVEKRSAFLKRRMTDVDCYLRAAWAVRTGADLYEIKDPNDWHYNYPPLFAILMVPLADPPDGEDRSGMFPFSVSVGIWYGFSLICLALAVHWLAGVVEYVSPDLEWQAQPWGCRRWWALRMIPILACLAPIGHTLARGQVNLLLLALLCGTLAATVRGRPWFAGFSMAGAICLKIFPAFLLLFPLWRRDFRCLSGCALGLAIGLGLVPLAVFGGLRTLTYYQKYATVLLAPGLGVGSDQSRAKEIIETTANDSQSLQATLHNTLHPVRTERPTHPSLLVVWTARLVGILMTLLTLLAAGKQANLSGPNLLLFFGTLVIEMLLLSPICHLHYFSLCVIVVMGLVAAAWERNGNRRLGPRLTLLFAAISIVYVLPNIPGWLILRDLALAVYPVLLLWLVGTIVLWKRSQIEQSLSMEWPVLSTKAA
jgi:hypothetical protein